MKISFIGDVAFTGIISEQPDLNATRFKAVSNLLAQSNLVIANLEVPVFANAENQYKNRIYYSDLLVTKILLKDFNIGCLSLANNHIYDCKMEGLKATINLLDKMNICHTGAGWLPQHVEPVIIERENCTIGFIAYVDRSTNPKTENFAELLINYFDIEKVKSDIQKLKNQVDKIVCSIHWGVDYSFYPTPEQRIAAQQIIDAGADIIMGHHPHTLQPYEKYKHGTIFYSLGGITFGDYFKKEYNEYFALFKKTKKGVIVQYDSNTKVYSFQSTQELKENFVELNNRCFEKWSKIKWSLYSLKHSSGLFIRVFNFKERFIDRGLEYFFGYYRNPFKRLFQIQNVKKIRRLFKKFKL